MFRALFFILIGYIVVVNDLWELLIKLFLYCLVGWGVLKVFKLLK